MFTFQEYVEVEVNDQPAELPTELKDTDEEVDNKEKPNETSSGNEESGS